MSELRKLAGHGGTVLVGQLAVMAFGVADTVIAGRHSDDALAALSIGSAFYVSVYVGLIGIVQALLPIWAELRGSRQLEALGRSLRQSLYLSALIIAAGTAALLFPEPLLRWVQVPDSMRDEVQGYLTVLAFAFAPSLLFRLYSTFNQSLGRPLLVTWLQLAGLAVKIPLSIWWVGGGAGVEPMGAVGCAWATLAVNYLLFAFAIALLATQAIYRPFQIWRRLEAPDLRQIAGFARLGIPAGMAYFVEVTSFTLMALFIARLGVASAAAHQIAASLAAVLYMTPLSLAIACSARVSYWIGAGQPQQARRVVGLGLTLAAGTALLLAGLTYTARHTLAGWYTATPEVRSAAAALLVWVALYHLADSIQAVSAFLLRSYRITFTPLVMYGLLLWGLGLYGGYLLTYDGLAGLPARRSAEGFWLASTLALVLAAASLLSLLALTVHKSVRQHGHRATSAS